MHVVMKIANVATKELYWQLLLFDMLMKDYGEKNSNNEIWKICSNNIIEFKFIVF